MTIDQHGTNWAPGSEPLICGPRVYAKQKAPECEYRSVRRCGAYAFKVFVEDVNGALWSYQVSRGELHENIEPLWDQEASGE